MYFVIFLIVFLVLLVAISIINLFLAFALKLVTNNTIEEYKFILPSILYLLISSITFMLMYLITINVLGLGLRESVMALVFSTVDITSKIQTIILLNSIIVIISILVQSVCLLTVNIDYTILLGKIRMFFKDMLKSLKKIQKNNKANVNKDSKNGTYSSKLNNDLDLKKDDNNLTRTSNLVAVVPENEIAENKERLKLSVINAIICTFFIFSFLSFIFMALFTIGNFLASKFI